MDIKKIIAAVLGGATLIGGTYAITVDNISNLETELTKIKNDKQVILEDNIWKSARLNEIPNWNVNAVSVQEMSSAYVGIANNKNATTTPNLFEGLRKETIKLGINCIK